MAGGIVWGGSRPVGNRPVARASSHGARCRRASRAASLGQPLRRGAERRRVLAATSGRRLRNGFGEVDLVAPGVLDAEGAVLPVLVLRLVQDLHALGLADGLGEVAVEVAVGVDVEDDALGGA